MRERFLDVPRLKVWHLLGLVAATAAFLAVFRFRGEARDPLVRVLREARYGDSQARGRAIQDLRLARLDRSDLLATFLTSLDDPDPEVRRRAALGLEESLQRRKWKLPVDPLVEQVKQRITKQLSDPDPKAIFQSSHTLVALGDNSQTLRDYLIERVPGIREANEHARSEALGMLAARFRSDETARTVILAAMRDPDSEVRVAAAWSLGIWQLEKAIPDSVIETLIMGLGDEAPRVRAASVQSLSSLRSQARSAVPATVRLLDDHEAHPRYNAVAALGNFGVYAEPALETLRALIDRDPEPSIRDQAERSVKSIEAALQTFRGITLPDLMSELSEDSAARRTGAAEQLGDYGPIAEPAVSLLRGLLSDPDAKVRAASVAALRRIEPGDVP